MNVLESAPFGDESHTGENIEHKLSCTAETWNVKGNFI